MTRHQLGASVADAIASPSSPWIAMAIFGVVAVLGYVLRNGLEFRRRVAGDSIDMVVVVRPSRGRDPNRRPRQ